MKLDEFLKDADQKAEYDAAVKAAIDNEVKGLKEKNKELLGKFKDAEKERDEIQAQLEEAQANNGKGQADVEKIRKDLGEKHAKELAKRDEKIASGSKRLNQLLIDKGLTDSLTKAGVAPQFLDATVALIKSKYKAEIAEEDDEPVAKIDGKGLGDFVKEWSQGDGKHYTAAPNNGGGGAKGSDDGKGKAGAKTMTRAEFDALNPGEKMKFSTEGGRVTDA